MFLYILNMNKVNMFKIGIASNINRIKQHLNTYNGSINLKESYIVNAKNDKTIKDLERQLLNDYTEYKITNNKYEHLDGASELRNISILDNVLEDIQYKANKLIHKEIKMTKGVIIKDHALKKVDSKILKDEFIYTSITKQLVQYYIKYIINNSKELNNINKSTDTDCITFRDNNRYKICEICTSSNLPTHKEILVLKHLFAYKQMDTNNIRSGEYKHCIKVDDFCNFINSRCNNNIFTIREITDIFFNIRSNTIKTKVFNKRIIYKCNIQQFKNGVIYIQCLFDKDIIDFIMLNNIFQ